MDTWLIVLIVATIITLIVWSVYVSDNYPIQGSEIPGEPIVSNPVVVTPVVNNDSQPFANWKNAKKQEILSKPLLIF
jgi:hypothetical protein